MGRKATDLVQLTLRLREDLRRRIEREAKKDDLSLNNEIVRRLERSFDYDDWRGERLVLITALRTHPALTPREKVAVEKAETADEEDFQKYEYPDLVKPKGGNS
jgi:hypothetical protein